MNLFVSSGVRKVKLQPWTHDLTDRSWALQNIFYARSTCNEAVEQFCFIVDQFGFTYLSGIVGFSITSVIVRFSNY